LRKKSLGLNLAVKSRIENAAARKKLEARG
jgi:hypothetical protein